MLLSFPYLVRAEAFCGLTRAEAFCGLTLTPVAAAFLTGWTLTVSLIYTMLPFGPGTAPRTAIRFGNGAADGDQVQLGVDLDDVKVLHGDLLHAHVACLLLAREDAGGIGARAHGARMTVDGAAAVARRGTALAEALDDAGVALALAGAGHVDLVALGEQVGLDEVADLQLAAVLKTELLEVLDHAHARLLQVAGLGLRQLLLGHVLVTELDGVVAFLFLGHLLHDHAGAGLDDGDRNDLSGLVEDLRHADLLADDGFLHWNVSSCWLLVASLTADAQRLAT